MLINVDIRARSFLEICVSNLSLTYGEFTPRTRKVSRLIIKMSLRGALLFFATKQSPVSRGLLRFARNDMDAI